MSIFTASIVQVLASSYPMCLNPGMADALHDYRFRV